MEESSVNVLYDLVEYMERERKRLLIATTIVLLLVPLALTLNLLGFFLMTKKILFADSELSRTVYRAGKSLIPPYFLISLNALTSIALVFLGIKNLLFLKSWGKKLGKVENIEKKIYEEVIKDNDIVEED